MLEMFMPLILAASGCTPIIVRSKIFESLRLYILSKSDGSAVSFGYAINCCQCMGLWVGLLFAVATVIYIPFQGIAVNIFFVSASAFATSLTALLADKMYFSY